ncbi:MAG: CPBP family intramembrane glutamic endopeptidase [Akkermansiaceae bacterium]|nr:CPBP family intramembrane glutamic endopeptidase [Akkermansiaceae bacterium]
MSKFLKSEAGAMVLWALFSLLGAAILTPWLYQAGKGLAAYCNAKETSAFIEWLGAACDRAEIGRYFSRALMLSALLLLPLLIRRIRRMGRAAGATRLMELQKLGAKNSLLHAGSAFLVAGAILWATGMILTQAGAFAADTEPVKSSRILTKCVLPAIGASLIEEWLFRGIVLGLWLRTSGPLKATIGSSLLFAFLHFLKPPGGLADPTHAFAGFELLGKLLLHFTEPQFFVTDFLTLTVVGIILCWARLRTDSLWFAIGLHAGWVFAYAAFNLYYNSVESPLHPWVVGQNLRSGIAPLIALILTAGVCRSVIRALKGECLSKS